MMPKSRRWNSSATVSSHVDIVDPYHLVYITTRFPVFCCIPNCSFYTVSNEPWNLKNVWNQQTKGRWISYRQCSLALICFTGLVLMLEFMCHMDFLEPFSVFFACLRAAHSIRSEFLMRYQWILQKNTCSRQQRLKLASARRFVRAKYASSACWKYVLVSGARCTCGEAKPRANRLAQEGQTNRQLPCGQQC